MGSRVLSRSTFTIMKGHRVLMRCTWRKEFREEITAPLEEQSVGMPVHVAKKICDGVTDIAENRTSERTGGQSFAHKASAKSRWRRSLPRVRDRAGLEKWKAWPASPTHAGCHAVATRPLSAWNKAS